MESSVPTPQHGEAAEARRALDDAAGSRERLVKYTGAPWWYHPVLAIGVGFGIASVALGGAFVPSGLIVGLVVVPTVLTWLLKRLTGVSINRTTGTTGVLRLYWAYLGILVVIVAAGALLHWGAGQSWGMFAAGALAAILTFITSRRTEQVLRADLQGKR